MISKETMIQFLQPPNNLESINLETFVGQGISLEVECLVY